MSTNGCGNTKQIHTLASCIEDKYSYPVITNRYGQFHFVRYIFTINILATSFYQSKNTTCFYLVSFYVIFIKPQKTPNSRENLRYPANFFSRYFDTVKHYSRSKLKPSGNHSRLNFVAQCMSCLYNVLVPFYNNLCDNNCLCCGGQPHFTYTLQYSE